jgi:hypothetical protein
MLVTMTPTGARNTVESVLRQHAAFAEDWYVMAKRERRCCWDPSCTKPRHELGGKIFVRVFPVAICRENADRLPQVERVLSAHLDGVVKTRIVPLCPPEADSSRALRPAVLVWVDW